MESKIKEIVDKAAKRGHDVTIRDIAYALMRVRFDDKLIAYTVIKGAAPANDSDVDAFDELDRIQYLIRFFTKEQTENTKSETSRLELINALTRRGEESSDDSMTFEENRAGIEAQIKEVLELKKQLYDEDGRCIDVKAMATLQKTEIDARAKLNDKFGAAEKSKQQYVIVQPKFTHICEYTRKECWLQTRDFAMQHWHLIEDPNWEGGDND